MKKNMALVMAAALAASCLATGCGNKAAETKADTTAETTAETGAESKEDGELPQQPASGQLLRLVLTQASRHTDIRKTASMLDLIWIWPRRFASATDGSL